MQQTLGKHKKLGVKFILLVIGILLVALALISTVIVYMEKKAMEEQLSEHGELLGRYVARISPDAILTFDFVRLNELVRESHRYEDIAYAVVVDNHGRVMTSYLDKNKPLVSSTIKRTGSENVEVIISALAVHKDVMQMTFPVSVEEEKLGSVLVGVGLQGVSEHIDKTLAVLLYGGLAIIFLLSGSLYAVFNQNVLQPVRLLGEGAERVASGELKQPVDLVADDELGLLTRAFNNMMQRLADEHQALLEINQQVQQQLIFQQLLIDTIDLPIFYKDRDGRYLGCNTSFKEAVGKSKSELIGRTSKEIVPVELAEEMAMQDQEVYLQGRVRNWEFTLPFADGTDHRVIMHKAPFYGSQGELAGLVGVYFDITDIRAAEAALKNLNEELELRVEQRTAELRTANRELERTSTYMQTVVDTIADPTLVINVSDYSLRLMNSSARQIYMGGRGVDKKLTCYMVSHKNDTPCSGADDPCPIHEVIETGKAASVVHKHFGATGAPLYIEVRASPMFSEKGEVTQIIETHHDITDHVEMQQLLKQQAETDVLTQVYNRRKFENDLSVYLAIADKTMSTPGVVMFDIDHFKQINDRYGHDVGDSVLKEMVLVVKSRLRREDVLARWGGEEFVVLLPDITPETITRLAEDLRVAVADHEFPTVGKVTASFGATVLKKGDLQDSLLRRVDVALYQSKQQGRDRSTVITD